MRMQCSAVTAFSWFALLALPCVAGELASANAPEKVSGAPRLGPNFTVVSSGIAMIWVAPGTFLMSGTHGSGDDTQVTLTHGYWLGRTEVTQEQWQAVMDGIPVPSYFKGSERPVEQVDWELVMAFCLKLTDWERAAGRLPGGYAYTLPTEAQWEYACRAGSMGIYAGDLAAMAWYDANSGGQTHPVAEKQPNAWGFYDMHGNVMEWCLDWYAAFPGGNVSDPVGTGKRQFHNLRGGSWNGPAGMCRSAFRHWSPTIAGSPSTGFRLALAPGISRPAVAKPD